jgi:hypothetical protein
VYRVKDVFRGKRLVTTRAFPPARGTCSCTHTDSFLDDIPVSEVLHHADQLLAARRAECSERPEFQPGGTG